MLQSYNAPQQAIYDESGRGTNLIHLWEVAKRRWLSFLFPFLLIFSVGAGIVAIQRPIYMAQGKILVEGQYISTDLVRPSVTDTANQRMDMIQQRLVTRENLQTIMAKFGLFPSQRQWMSGFQLLDLMRERTKLQTIDMTRPGQRDHITIALAIGFEYEDPQISLQVADEYLSQIIGDDMRTRTQRAMETTNFLAREVKRLEAELGATNGRIAELKRRPRPSTAASDQLASQLTGLKSELVQKASLYSDAHPEIRALRRKIAGLEQAIGRLPQPSPGESGVEELEKQGASIEKNLEDASRKLTAARLGESLERSQQSERLQVIEQPGLPQKPSRPKRMKWLAIALAMAGIAGLGVVLAVEATDRSIRSAQQLAGVVSGHLIVPIPYLTTTAEKFRRYAWILCTPIALVGVAWIAAYYLGVSLDLSTLMDQEWVEMLRSWTDTLTGLSK